MKRLKKFVDKKVDEAFDRVNDILSEVLIDELSDNNFADDPAPQHLSASYPFSEPSAHALSHYPPTYSHPQQQYPYPYHQPQYGTESPKCTYPHSAQSPWSGKAPGERQEDVTDTAQLMDQVFNQTSPPNRIQHNLYPLDAGNPVNPEAFANHLGHQTPDLGVVPPMQQQINYETIPWPLDEKGKAIKATIFEIERDHDAMPGPRWSLVQDSHSVSSLSSPYSESEMSSLRYAMSGVEAGVTFSAYNASRYNALGDSALERVLAGVSRPINLSCGIKDLHTLAAQVLARDITLAARTVHDIRNSTVPIFAVSYLPTRSAFQAAAASPSGASTWDMDQDHMQQLFIALHTLTGGRRARIWLRDIAKLSYSPGARWERISIVPFTIFPTIVLQDKPQERRRDVLRMFHEQSAIICLGVIEIDAQPHDMGEGMSPTWGQLQFRSRQNARVTKRLGRMNSAEDAFNSLASMVINERVVIDDGSARSSPEEARRQTHVMTELRMLSVQVMRGDSVTDIVLGRGNVDQIYHLGGHKEAVFKHLSEHALEAHGISGVSSQARAIPRYACGQRWSGTSEFVMDVALAKALEFSSMKRTYRCVYNDAFPWIAAAATLEGPVKLHGLLLVRKESKGPWRGVVEQIVPNYPPSMMVGMGMAFLKTHGAFAYFSWFGLQDDVMKFPCPGGWEVVELTFDELQWS